MKKGDSIEIIEDYIPGYGFYMRRNVKGLVGIIEDFTSDGDAWVHVEYEYFGIPINKLKVLTIQGETGGMNEEGKIKFIDLVNNIFDNCANKEQITSTGKYMNEFITNKVGEEISFIKIMEDEQDKWEGHAKCPKCGEIAKYNPYDKEFDCKNDGIFKDESNNTMWLENLEK